MKLSYRVFWLPKEGLSTDEYEDAFAPAEATDDEINEFRCAVADGATETSFSGLWAEMLCKAYLDKNFDLLELQASWLKTVSGKELPWYAEQKLESGAFATIMGLSISEEKDKLSWTARALGDSCLFHIQSQKIASSMPLTKWEEFDTTPLLLSSNQSANEGIMSQQKHHTGHCERGDIFYLMTDAISKWFLRRSSDHDDAISMLEAIENKEQFEKLVQEQRHIKDDKGRAMMPNDDVTWTRVKVLS